MGKTSREILAEQSGESHEQIRKYIRLTSLIPELLSLVDENKIAMRPAVELSYLSPDEQAALSDCSKCRRITLSIKFHSEGISFRK